MGTQLIHCSLTSSSLMPVLSEMELARDPSLSVSVNPGRMLLIVMQAGSSRDSDFAHDAMEPLSVLDSPMLSIGSLTEVEMMFTINVSYTHMTMPTIYSV